MADTPAVHPTIVKLILQATCGRECDWPGDCCHGRDMAEDEAFAVLAALRPTMGAIALETVERMRANRVMDNNPILDTDPAAIVTAVLQREVPNA